MAKFKASEKAIFKLKFLQVELDFCKGPNKGGPKEEKGYQVCLLIKLSNHNIRQNYDLVCVGEGGLEYHFISKL